jgi:hypothetical protein
MSAAGGGRKEFPASGEVVWRPVPMIVVLSLHKHGIRMGMVMLVPALVRLAWFRTI